jgi:hypothetical protein
MRECKEGLRDPLVKSKVANGKQFPRLRREFSRAVVPFLRLRARGGNWREQNERCQGGPSQKVQAGFPRRESSAFLQGLKPTFTIPYTSGLKPRPPKETFIRLLLVIRSKPAGHVTKTGRLVRAFFESSKLRAGAKLRRWCGRRRRWRFRSRGWTQRLARRRRCGRSAGARKSAARARGSLGHRNR